LLFGFITGAALLGAALMSLALNLPVTGDDGGTGLRLREAVTLAVDDLRAQGVNVSVISPHGAEAVENAHQDEGTDNSMDVAAAPSIARAAARENAHVVIGPLRTNVAVAEAPTLRRLHEVAISGTAGGPSEPSSPVFRLAPSEQRLALTAYRAMRRSFGSRICVLNDGSDDGRRRAAIISALPGVIVRGNCVAQADAVYFSTTSREPVFCSARTATRAGPHRLLVEVSHRGFDPTDFIRAGPLFRAEATPLARTPAMLAVAQRYHARAFVLPDDAALRTYAAVQIGVQAIRRAGSTQKLAAVLRTQTFSTILGPMRFAADGDPVSGAVRVVRLN
jgi:ABC-type branched-subunit amino acid transport system substrate-binding protein